MLVKDVMTRKLITVTPDDTLGHAATLLRQFQFHHLPVVQGEPAIFGFTGATKPLYLEGLLTSQDIDLAVAASAQQPWQERHVQEVMDRSPVCVTPTTSVAAAAQVLVERGLNGLPVVEYEQQEQRTRTLLVGLLTRSDLLIALARALGAFEPGMQLLIPFTTGNPTPLARLLLLAAELHVQVRSLVVVPPKNGQPRMATVRLGTINPAPLLMRLQDEGIEYSFPDLALEERSHDQA
ncbi:CBS domain-containing protein [Thermogemmatispora onikobensis]|uniref:CBS domain-containing protein n=1 Tax=Thermogemmatispora onikobensis TaxID=732234 RepID=UPI0008535001|nr:CBS domain-containing protein [Thermogemmatispora onikobensis]